MKNVYSGILVLCIFFLSSLIGISAIPLRMTKTNTSTELQYFDLVNSVFNFTQQELDLLEQNNFVVLNRKASDDIQDLYHFYWQNDLPIMITTDTLLHTWHLIFDKSLEDTEERFFSPLLSDLTQKAMQNLAMTSYQDNSALKNAFIFCTVAACLQNPNTSIPSTISTEVQTLLNAINSYWSIRDAISSLTAAKIPRFIDDFTMYRPRGHYTKSDNLQRYFKAYKWFSRIPFFCDKYVGMDTLQSSPIELIQSAVSIVWAIKNSNIEWKTPESEYFPSMTLLNLNGSEIMRIFSCFLEKVIGKTYCLNFNDVNYECDHVLGHSDWSILEINSNNLQTIQNNILTNESYLLPKSGFAINYIEQSPLAPKTIVFFGEALTLDTYTLNHLVWPYVTDRFLPNGLDFASICLNSTQAYSYISPSFADFYNYSEMVTQMSNELYEMPITEKLALHWQWIETLQPLVKSIPETNITGAILPPFMQKNAWMDEKLTTVMGSWAQLKHDTILYSQHGYTPSTCSTPFGYVEPYPMFYRSLRQVCSQYKDIFQQLLNYNINFTETYVNTLSKLQRYNLLLESLSNSTLELEKISNAELAGIALTEEQRAFIQTTYGLKNCGSGHTATIGWLGRLLDELVATQGDVYTTSTRSSLVADIHTDVNSDCVLHAATGYLENLIAVVPTWNSQMAVVVGPVFSYYEFALAGYQRLTDNDWRGILQLHLQQPNAYNYSVLPRGFWAASYMTSLKPTNDLIYPDSDPFTAPIWFIDPDYNPSSDTTAIPNTSVQPKATPISFLGVFEGFLLLGLANKFKSLRINHKQQV